MIEIQCVGAAQTVTGSKHIVRTSKATILLDCGLYQGRRHESVKINRELGFKASSMDAVVLSHAHIDHSGVLPVLPKSGFNGVIYATSATRDLCAAMLLDAANVQLSDARHINRLIEKGQSNLEPVEPLYDEKDVTKVMEKMVSLPYHVKQMIAPGVSLTFIEAGHVLGSAVTLLDIEDEGVIKRIVFTGDLGRHNKLILRDPEVATQADCLMIETTYGDRLHPPLEETRDELYALVRKTYEAGGKIIIPSFALERTQELIRQIRLLRQENKIPPIPVYIDSPLAIKVTEIFKLHPECYDDETRALLSTRETPFSFEGLRYVSDVEESKALTRSSEPAIVIAASGMCEAGRVLHHLKACVSDPKNLILIVGFQAQHTLGRRIVERRPQIKIFGLEYDLRAAVSVVNGLSAHADQKDLLEYAEGVRRQSPKLNNVILVHGDPKPQEVFAGLLRERGFQNVHRPAKGDTIQI